MDFSRKSTGELEISGEAFSDLQTDITTAGGDFHSLVKILTSNFKTNFGTEGTANFNTAKMVYFEALTIGWSRDRFFEHLKDFLKRHKYATFNVAEFFESMTKLRLKTYSQLLTEIDKNPSIQNQIDRFIFQNSDGTELTTYWIEKGVLSDYQTRVLSERSEHEKKAFKELKQREVNTGTRPYYQLPPAQRPLFRDSEIDRLNAKINGLNRDVSFLLSEIEKIRRAVFVHAEEPTVLFSKLDKIKVEIENYYAKKTSIVLEKAV